MDEKFRPNSFRVTDFISWQETGSLDLNPKFQRRAVWKAGAKSYLIDSMHKGLPVPLVFLRERLDLGSGQTIREVVDGQQRLRTVLSYVAPNSLKDFDPKRDGFVVSRNHSRELAGKEFHELSDDSKERIYSYEFSVQTLPRGMTDSDVLEIFARLNSTGQTLSAQELRNAAYFGALKTLMYRLAFRYTDQWLAWGVFTPDQLARMAEVEMTSDLVYNILNGLSSKSQARLNRMYREYDQDFSGTKDVERQFCAVMDTIQTRFGEHMKRSAYSREVHFFTLFVYTYDLMFDLESDEFLRKPGRLPSSYEVGLAEASRRLKSLEVPANVLDAFARASADYGRRRTRLEYLREVVDLAG